MMRIYDVSLTISPRMPVWPGDPDVELERIAAKEDGADFNISRIAMGVHTGTHIDAPSHIIANGSSAESVSLKILTGRAYVLNLPDVDEITAAVLRQADIPPRTRRLLFKTRNSDGWANASGNFMKDFVAISADGAQYLVDRGVKLVGVDSLSVAPFSSSVPTHAILLQSGTVILEGLDLSHVSQGRYTLYCLPLKLQGSDGSPARVILIGV
jgi:arylformamidase